MADDETRRQLSLVPYIGEGSREVVLRHGKAVVLYDPLSHELSVGETHLPHDRATDPPECPMCHRPWKERAASDGRGRSDAPGATSGLATAEPPLVDRDYFQMLAASQRNTPDNSGISGFGRFLRPAIRSGRSREVSGSHATPADAEFVASEPAPASREGISKSAFSPGYFKQFFVEKGELGRGGNGVVLLVEHMLGGTSLGQFACKRIPVGDDQQWLDKVLVEVKLLQGIPHRNLVPCHWVWLEDYRTSPFAPSIPCLWMLQEYCNGGDLHRYVIGPQDKLSATEKLKQRLRRKSKGETDAADELRGPSKLPFEDIFSFFKDITSGLNHLHTKGYIHRDLKPSNCLIQWDGNRKRVLISDFGEVQAADAKRRSSGATGTISYCAPEVLRPDAITGTLGDFTTKSDIFSLGMTVYFMCFGRLPYSNVDDVDEENEDLDELRAEIIRWTGFDGDTRLRPDLPEKLYRFLRRLLSLDPHERPSTEDILASIKGGVALDDLAFQMPEDRSTRIATADSAYRPPSSDGRPTNIHPRPTLSATGRPQSGELVRSRSPIKRDPHTPEQPLGRSDSPQQAAMSIQRIRKISTAPPLQDKALPTPKSPRLMLPPPPEPGAVRKAIGAFQAPPAMAIMRTLVFLAKVFSLSIPCSPYAANPWLLYPLLGVAALDLGILDFEFRRTVILLGLHLSLVTFAHQHGRLCEAKAIVWEGY